MQKYAQLISKYTLCVADWWELGRRAKIDREEWNGMDMGNGTRNGRELLTGRTSKGGDKY